MLIDNDDLGKVINETNPGINLGLFHAKGCKDYLRYFLWRVLKKICQVGNHPTKWNLECMGFFQS